jgi:hypothetical protein
MSISFITENITDTGESTQCYIVGSDTLKINGGK